MISASLNPADWTPPPEFEEYRLVQEIGRGAMGRVFLARDLLLERMVAVKFILAREPPAAVRERFFNEARALARLQHPNVVAVFRVGEVQRHPYLVSEYVRGQRLDQLPKPVPPKKVLELAHSLAAGLAAAHRVQVLHRDLKPSNAIIAEDGQVKLLDFGLAELSDGGRRISPAPADGSSAGDGDQTVELPALVQSKPREAGSTTPESTPSGRVLGTPRYLAPEGWRGVPPTRQADVYALGMVLFELCAGRTAFAEVPVAELPGFVQEHAAPRVQSLAPDVPPALAALVDACLALDPAARPASGDAVHDALEALGSARLASEEAPADPYPGLSSFAADQRPFFFGRSQDVRAVLERLRSGGPVVIAGDSGVGKSSLCRAGVLPAVADGALGRGAPPVPIPITPGMHPASSIAAALAPVLGEGEEALCEALLAAPADIARLFRSSAASAPALVFVDAMEELWTVSAPEEAEAAFRFFAELARPSRAVRLLVTLRSDFLTRLSAVAGLGDELGYALHLLRPLSAEALREAITAPAAAKGFRFESPEQIDALARGVAGAPGSLPLVQFTLAQLWSQRDDQRRLIPAAALTSLGGVEAALARHADAAIAGLPLAQRGAAQRVLCDLVTAEGTRQRRTREELARGSAAAEAALQALVKARLVVATDAASGSAGGYELAHEALLRGWDTLRGWLGRDAEKRAMRQRLQRAASDWDAHQRDRAYLWSRRQLDEAFAARVTADDLGPLEAAFADASRRVVLRRRLTLAVVAAALPLSVATAYGVARYRAARELNRAVEVRLDEATAALAEAGKLAGSAAQARGVAFGAFDSGQVEKAERSWEKALDLGRDLDDAHGRAQRALEAALMLDPSRAADIRRQLAALALDELRDAEERVHLDEAETHAERVMAYDPDGLGKQVAAPVPLDVSTEPEADLVLEQFDDLGRLTQERRDLGRSPATSNVEPGSWLLEATEPGRTPVRLPFLARRGVPVKIQLDLPYSSAVPPGFVYVPRGEFILGSADPEEMRRGFFNAFPAHRVTTGAFLIGSTEVTFGQWLEMIRSLPPADRTRLLPDAVDRPRAVRVSELPDGAFELRLVIADHTYLAREGSPIVYERRSRRQRQDWRLMPVTGISFDDAQRYFAWLDATGQVKGARFCTEVEWERAARGADGRAFPSGSSLDPDDADIDITYGREPLGYGPDEVGSHPASRSPFGIDDLAGNVWEMVVAADPSHAPIIRGGSWYHGDLTARSVNREFADAKTRTPVIGLRACADAPSGGR